MTFTAAADEQGQLSLRKGGFSRIFDNNARLRRAMMPFGGERLPSLRGNRIGRHLKLDCTADNRKLVNFAAPSRILPPRSRNI